MHVDVELSWNSLRIEWPWAFRNDKKQIRGVAGNY